MSDALTPDAAAAICRHMNDDHADAIVAYARHFAHLEGVVSARMSGIDPHGMDIDAATDGATVAARVLFDHPLADARDARTTLIAMARAADSSGTNGTAES